jgi:hypothetical protein
MNDLCYAKLNQGEALVWTTIAFFAGFAGVSALGPIVPKLKNSMALLLILWDSLWEERKQYSLPCSGAVILSIRFEYFTAWRIN